jgi:Cof subfamily protein (haloacid dehalogenase superfamily)
MVGIDTPIIASNGAYIREKDRDEVIYAMPLGEKNANEVVRLSGKYGLYCHLLTWDSIFTEKLVYSSINYSKWNKDLPEDRRVNINVIEKHEWNNVISNNKDDILKAIITDDDTDKVLALRQDVSKLNVEIASSYSNNFEVMNRDVSKGSAVKTLAEFYNIPTDEIICIGDNENDISMIKYAGLGIAMGNGTDEVKKAAGFVTLTNENDGVAYAVEKFIL